MNKKRPAKRCAIYTRKSSEEGLEQDFNSLHAQREACEAYIKSQAREGWRLIKHRYDDGGFSGGNLERPGLRKLLADIERGRVDVVVVYKVDRLTRSLADFARLVDRFEVQDVSFVSVTQQFNTTSSMGRLTLNVLLSFAQFEREVTGERIRDKVKASRKKGMWMGGVPPLGYDVCDRKLVINAREAETVRRIFRSYLDASSVSVLAQSLEGGGVRSKHWISASGREHGGKVLTAGAIYKILQNQTYRGLAVHKGTAYPGEHQAIIDEKLWHAVQAKLDRGRFHRVNRQPDGTPQSLLTGLLQDDQGHPMSPAHARRKGQRYRYYVSQPVLKGRPDNAGSLSRIPALLIEQFVQDVLGQLAAAHIRKKETMHSANALFNHLKRVQVSPDWIVLVLDEFFSEVKNGNSDHLVLISLSNVDRKSGVTRIQQCAEVEVVAQGDGVSIKIPIRLKTRGGEKVIVSPDGSDPLSQRRPDETLIKAVARAYRWRRRLERGELHTLEDIAKLEGLTEAYVRRLLPLAFLAPDLIEGILDGTQAASLTLQKLTPASISLSWAKQRDLFLA